MSKAPLQYAKQLKEIVGTKKSRTRELKERAKRLRIDSKEVNKQLKILKKMAKRKPKLTKEAYIKEREAGKNDDQIKQEYILTNPRQINGFRLQYDNSKKSQHGKPTAPSEPAPNGSEPTKGAQDLDKYFLGRAINTQVSLNLERSAAQTYLDNTNEDGFVIDDKGNVVKDPEKIAQINVGSQIYEGWHKKVADKIYKGDNLSPQLEAVRNRAIGEALGLSATGIKEIESYFRTGTPVGLAGLLSGRVTQVRQNLVEHENEGLKHLLTNQVAQDKQAQDTLIGLLENAGAELPDQVKEQIRKIPQAFKEYAEQIGDALSKTPNYK